MKMNVYQEISQIIKEADGILIGASNGLSIAWCGIKKVDILFSRIS